MKLSKAIRIVLEIRIHEFSGHLAGGVTYEKDHSDDGTGYFMYNIRSTIRRVVQQPFVEERRLRIFFRSGFRCSFRSNLCCYRFRN
ncbi:hypothetical protein PHOSAC3_120332 [Mesotoga infera]|nr:hypothetical protein PHOSAC3_120332 [Mesotoga infera]